jgi:hypothetical protein
MIRSWRERIGLFIGSIFGQRSIPSAAPVGTGPSITWDAVAYVDTSKSKIAFISRLKSAQVER